jgi:hypothetical protein
VTPQDLALENAGAGTSSHPKLVASGTDGAHKALRVVARGAIRTIEVAVKDALGAESWTKVVDVTMLDIDAVGWGPAHGALVAVLHILDDTADKLTSERARSNEKQRIVDALGVTMTY